MTDLPPVSPAREAEYNARQRLLAAIENRVLAALDDGRIKVLDDYARAIEARMREGAPEYREAREEAWYAFGLSTREPTPPRRDSMVGRAFDDAWAQGVLVAWAHAGSRWAEIEHQRDNALAVCEQAEHMRDAAWAENERLRGILRALLDGAEWEEGQPTLAPADGVIAAWLAALGLEVCPGEHEYGEDCDQCDGSGMRPIRAAASG